MKIISRNLPLLCALGCLSSANAEILLHERFESPDVSGSSALQHGATYKKGAVPNNGKWVKSTQGFGADRIGLVNKSFGDFSGPNGNLQGFYFGYTNTGLTSSTSAIAETLQAGVKYTVSFNVARDNNVAVSNYRMELVAFTSAQGDSARQDTRSGSKPGTILATTNGTVASNNLSKKIIFTFTPDATIHAAHLGKNLGVRFIGDSTCPILDNVMLTTSGGVLIDTDQDGMSDSWEVANFGALSFDGAADTDGDTLIDLFEYQAYLDPNDTDTDNDGNPDTIGIHGYLLAERWNNISGESLADLVGEQAFYQSSDQVEYLSEAKAPSDAGDNYGLRMSGTLIAPKTGSYTFWIAAGGESHLYLSTDSTIFNRRKIAVVSTPSSENGWDDSPVQKSYTINLVAGESYFIETLMKEGTDADHLSVAWQYTGQTRQVIPGTYLKSFVPNSEDLDEDGMLDSWEIQVGLDPNDNGGTVLNQSGYGNIDGDDLLNFEEYTKARNPLLVDAPEGVQGFVEWQRFNIGINSGVAALTNHTLFAQNLPSSAGLFPGGEAPANAGDYYGRRMRGVITIPTTGTYHFYVSGDDSAKLFINPNGISRFGKIYAAQSPKSVPINSFSSLQEQKSVPYTLTQGDRLYFEILQVDYFGADHCSIGWSGPPATTPVVIPGSALSTCGTEKIEINGQLVENDADGDSIPDNWEIANALMVTNQAGNASANGEYGDPDGDGLTNFEEYKNGTNPLAPNGIPNKWSQQIYSNLGGNTISVLTGSTGVLRSPNWTRLATSPEELQNYADAYGQRLRAILSPEVSGNYTFWVSGDDSVQLWLSTDGRKFFKRRIAYIQDNDITAYDFTGFREWDKLPGQRSVPISLVAGQQYFIEILHKESSYSDHVSVAWALNASAETFAFLPDAATSSVKIFSDITLSSVTEASAVIAGAGQSAPSQGAAYFFSNDGQIASFQAQWVEGGNTRAVKVKLTQTSDGISASQIWSRSMTGNVLGQDFEQLSGYTTVSIGSTGYGVTSVALSDVNGVIATSRKVIDSSFISSYVSDPDDVDDDYLVDSWENQFLDTGASSENGLNNPNLGEYGDPDSDSITNRDEWLLGTDPNNSDTDGDSYGDGQEVYFLGTNPLVPELANPSVVGSVVINGVANSSGTWVPTADGGMLSMDNRGWIDYNIQVTTEGFYLFEILGRARGSNIFAREDFALDVLVDSTKVASTVLTSLNGQQGMSAGFAGWLEVGSHTIRIWNNNLLGRRTLQLDSIRLLLPSGNSTQIAGLPDWLYDFLAARSSVENGSGGSLVSPVCLEGESRNWALTSVFVNGSAGQVVQKGTNNRWFADVDLSPSAPVNVGVSFENGIIGQTDTIEWLSFNVVSGLPVKLRVGDSLRLTAYTVGEIPDNSAVSFTINGQSIGNTTADAPLAYEFTTAGTYTLEASYIASGGVPATATATIQVVGADFGPAFPLYMDRSRLWNLPNVPYELPIKGDESIAFSPKSASGSGQSYIVDVNQLGTNTVIARTAHQGPVVTSGRIDGLLLSKSADGEISEIYVYPNGDRIVEMTIFASSLPPGGYVEIELWLGGRVFLPSGSTVLTLHEADFGENGIATYRVLLSSGVGHACQRTEVFQADGTPVGKM